MAAPKHSPQSTMQQLAPYLGLGFQLAGAMVLFGGIGWWIDSQSETKPWLMVTGLVLGSASGMIQIIRASNTANKESAKRRLEQKSNDASEDPHG